MQATSKSRVLDGLAGVLAAVVLLVVLAIISIGVWQLGWFVKAKNVEKQVHITNVNTGTQTAWHDEAIDAISRFKLLDPASAQAGALRNQACGLIARLSSDYRDDTIAAFQSQECS